MQAFRNYFSVSKSAAQKQAYRACRALVGLLIRLLKALEPQALPARPTRANSTVAQPAETAVTVEGGDRFASLASMIPGVVYQRTVSPQGDIRYTYISEGARGMFGVAPEEVLRDPEALFKTFSDDYKTNFRQRLIAASQSLSKWDVEASIVGSDGRTRYTHAIANPERLADGTVLWTGLVLDATRIKQAEEELKEATQAKSMFLASMSHEIRTPMNGVLGMADLLMRTQLTTHQQRLVSTINQSARTLLTIINDILDFSRIEAQKLELDNQEFELRQCVESAIEILAEEAYKKHLELNLLLPSSLPVFVIGDTGRLRQVLVNLIGNAVKFTREGEVTLRVTDCGEREGKTIIGFSVSDTGIGIDKATQERLFKPFSQADSSVSRSYGGTGLGLSITQNLVRMMEGQIKLESEIGKGTTVTFEIVLAKSARTDFPRIAPPSIIHGKRVLVVDDRAVNREIICSYLQDCGALIETAGSAEEALLLMRDRAASNRAFDMALLDMIMPGVNGLELARRIKAAPELADVRLIMITSLSWKGDSKVARDVGIGELLSKPIRRSELLEAVQKSYSAPAIPAFLSGPAPQPAAATCGPLAGLRVLLAEDNPVNQEVAREYAMSLGCDIHVADNGRIAVETFSTSTFGVVLMDCQMPEMDGLTACRKIRAIERERGLARTPVIAVTANAYDSDRMMCLAADMDDFIGKPFTQDQLADMLTKWVQPKASPVEENPDTSAAPSRSVNEAVNEASAETLDPTALRAFEHQRSGMAARLAEIFLLTAPKAVRQIMMAIVEGNHERIQTAAHGLKSSSANMGAQELKRLAEWIETQARKTDPMSDCLATALRLEAEMCNVESALAKTSWLADKRKAG